MSDEDETGLVPSKRRGRPLGLKNKAQSKRALSPRIKADGEKGRVYRFPSSGPGWGGPAKGKGKPMGAKDNFDTWNAMKPNERRDYLAERAEQAQEALDIMVKVMRESPHAGLQLAAAEKVRNQIMGTPIQRTIVDKQPIKRDVIDPADLTLEERDALRSTLEKVAMKRAANGDEE